MKPIDIEHEILLALHSTPCKSINAVHRRISTPQGDGPGWREVANKVRRLERRGWVHVAGQHEVRGDWFPAYSLTEVGRCHADKVRQQQANALGEVHDDD